MRHVTIAEGIREAVGAEEYDRAEALIAEYTRAVADSDAAAVAGAQEFVQATLVHLRAQRAHMVAQLRDLQVARPYLTPDSAPAGSVDCTG